MVLLAGQEGGGPCDWRFSCLFFAGAAVTLGRGVQGIRSSQVRSRSQNRPTGLLVAWLSSGVSKVPTTSLA